MNPSVSTPITLEPTTIGATLKDEWGQHEAAIEDYNQALRIPPRNAHGYSLSGLCES